MASSGAGDNWYDVLHLTPQASPSEIADATERLARQGAALATTAPERSQHVRDTVRAIRADLLAGLDARARYDRRLEDAGASAGSTADDQPTVRYPDPPVAPAWSTSTPAPAQGQGTLDGSPTTHGPPSVPAQANTRPGVIDSVVNGIIPTASRFRRFLQSGWTCPACGTDGGPADKFCKRCGAPMKTEPTAVPSNCSGCGTKLTGSERFCPRCGQAAP